MPSLQWLGLSHPEEDEMVLLDSKQGDSFKVITKMSSFPSFLLKYFALSSATLCRLEEAVVYLNYIESLGTSALTESSSTGIKVPQGITLPTCHT